MTGNGPKSPLDTAWPWIVRIFGLLLLIYETVFEHTDRPTLLLVAAAMIGLPEFIRWDRKKNGGSS